MMVILNTWFTEVKSPSSGLSFCILVCSILIEIKILLIGYILDHFVRHLVGQSWRCLIPELKGVGKLEAPSWDGMMAWSRTSEPWEWRVGGMWLWIRKTAATEEGLGTHRTIEPMTMVMMKKKESWGDNPFTANDALYGSNVVGAVSHWHHM